MTDSNNKNGPACPGDEFLARSDNDDTNELLNIIAKQPPEQTDSADSVALRDTAGGAARAEDHSAPEGGVGPGSGGIGLGGAVAAGRAASSQDDTGRVAPSGMDAERAAAAPGTGGRSPQSSQSGQPGQPGEKGAPNPRWGRAAYGGASTEWAGQGSNAFPGAPGGGNVPPNVPPGMAQGGAWLWLPRGVEQKRPWRKRHPVLFWGGVLLVLALVFGWGRMSGEESPLGGPKIAVINVDGIILDADDIVAFMEKVRKDDSYKGAVLRINSPGGAVGPSQEIYQAAKRLGAQKPLVASMGSLAASGGYYAALGAETILAGPSTLTASIGVKMQIPNIEELMRTIGISEKTLTTGALKDAGSSWREMSPEEEAYFMALLTDMYEEFIETVARERDMPLDKVRALADGRAMTGRQALAAGLVDGMGDRQEAVRRVKSMAGLAAEPVRLVSGPEKPGGYLSDLLKSAMNGVLNERAGMEQPRFFY